MNSQRTLKNKVLIEMRKLGFIKKKKYMRPMKVRTITGLNCAVSDIEAQRHVYIVNKLSVKKNCNFNAETKTCVCGASLNEFLLKNC